MSYNHETRGWEQYEQYINGLVLQGISVVELPEMELQRRGQQIGLRGHGPYRQRDQQMRTATFITKEGSRMVVEEWLAVDDQDCDGVSFVGLLVYPMGKRPQVVTQVLEN